MLRKRAILLAPLMAMFAFVATTVERAEAAWSCTGTQISQGDDIGAIILIPDDSAGSWMGLT